MTRAERPPRTWRSVPHDSETAAASHLGGALRPPATRTFERHLLGCEQCWQEVDAGRAGRRLAESARQVAPPELREQLRAVIASQTSGGTVRPAPFAGDPAARSLWRQRPWLHSAPRAWAAVAGGLALAAASTLLVLGHPGAGRTGGALRQPAAIGAAVADFRLLRLPGTQIPRTAAPDLTQVRLRPLGAAAGVVGGRAVTAYSYEDATGRDLLVYLSREAFPTALGAQRLTGPDGPWITTTEGVTVLCARSPHALLVLGQDRQLVLDVARALAVT